MIAKILVVTQAQQLDRLFDYQIPESMRVFIGCRVIVPFQNRNNLGFVWELVEQSEFSTLKDIYQLIDERPVVTPIQIKLINWLAEYYFCSRADAVKCCLPPGTKTVKKRYYRLNGTIEEIQKNVGQQFSQDEVIQAISLISAGERAGWSCENWQQKFSRLPLIWTYLLKNQHLLPVTKINDSKIEQKRQKLFRLVNPSAFQNETSAALRVKEVLSSCDAGLTRVQLCATAEVSSSVIDRLFKETKLDCYENVTERRPIGFDSMNPSKTVAFTEEQQTAVQAIIDPLGPQHFLLHGVTGSGKTEVYFEAAAHYIRNGCQILYLVPEISLTPQMVERARSRFGEEVALLHSNMSDGERYDQWFKIRNQTANLVIGARSAVFAPFANLGLIIVDEEHESSYKQEDAPRYHIRQVVEKLSDLTSAKVVFGSATPAIESFFYAKSGHFGYLQLRQRFNNQSLPAVTMVDMRDELKSNNRNILSRSLYQAIQETLDKREQVILLLNRRGHSTFVLCRDCGNALKCPSCDVSLTYHITEKFLRCHYCDFRQIIPEVCPKCRGNRIRYFGHGTQKLEEELATYFPNALVVRMDVDSTSKKGAHYEIYKKLTTGSVDILLGTQMIAKGLDLPGVTLVGVISADSTLNLPDFRAAERTFQLLTQVAGRAGRGQKPGKVIFQSYNQEHYSIQNARTHDYLNFYEQEIQYRQELRFPPFSELVKIGFSGIKLTTVIEAANEFSRILRTVTQRLTARDLGNSETENFIEVLGPAPALIPRIQDNYRWQILIKTNNSTWIETSVKQTWDEFPVKKFADVRVYRDRNPFSVI